MTAMKLGLITYCLWISCLLGTCMAAENPQSEKVIYLKEFPKNGLTIRVTAADLEESELQLIDLRGPWHKVKGAQKIAFELLGKGEEGDDVLLRAPPGCAGIHGSGCHRI